MPGDSEWVLKGDTRSLSLRQFARLTRGFGWFCQNPNTLLDALFLGLAAPKSGVPGACLAQYTAC